ncbi:HEAT repeat domain-containing protein [Cystobacter ferrugineus]|uniref:PBS lyase n=1 Tax=Cystobacter ferrugineus TaxID=83449 RepID=A0A1L9AYR4_9BACT|nr:HEAT repeat domain-containing protein [Cystobacter ferrugineus]OJH35157.1 hypothetical protein BON30_39535 [Cystobacter ferrugineus]
MNEVDLSEVLGWETERIRRDAAAVARLVHAALEAPEPQQRAAIARLAQVVARKVPQSICQGLSARLPALLDRPDAVSRYVGARLVRNAGEVPAALPALLRGLGAEEAEVREACGEALWNIRFEPGRLVPHLRSERAWERAAALGQMKPFMQEALRPELRRMLADPEDSLRHQAALWLEYDMEAPGLWEVLLDAARTGRSVLLREHALQRLLAWGLREEAVSVMLELLKTDPEERIRESAARQLEALAPILPEVARALLEALRDASAKVGKEAAASLARRGVTTGAIVPRLFTALEDTSLNEQVRGQVAITLARLKERAVVPVLMRLLELPDEAFEIGLDEFSGLMSSPLMKVDMARALGEAGPFAQEAVPMLLRCARTSRGMLQWEAIQAMERLGTTREELEALGVKTPGEADPETR